MTHQIALRRGLRIDRHRGWSTATILPLTLVIGTLAHRGACQELSLTADVASDVRSDAFGDPIPSYALARIGTDRFRHPQTIDGLAVSSNEAFIVTYGGSQVCIWRFRDGELLRTIEPPLSWPNVDRIVVSPDDRFIAIHGGRGEVCVHDVTSGELAWKDYVCQNVLGDPSYFTYSSDGKFLVLCGGNGVAVWDANGATPSYTYRVPRITGYDPSSHSVFHRNGTDTVVWQTSLTSGRRRTFSTHSGREWRIVGMQTSSDGKWAVETWRRQYKVPAVEHGFDRKVDYEVRVIATSTGKTRQVWHCEGRRPRVVLYPDQPYLVHVNEENAEFYDLSQRNPLAKPAFISDRFGRVASKHNYLVYARDQSVVFYDWKKQAAVPRASHDGQVASAHFSHDGRWLVTELGVWELRTSRLAWRFAEPECEILGFSADSRHLLRTRDKKIYWHDVASGKMTRELTISAFVAPIGTPGSAFDYSPARELVAVSDNDRVVIVDAASGEPRLESKRIRWPPREVRFSPTGNYLVSVGRKPDPYSDEPDEPPEVLLWDLARFESPKRLQFDSLEIPQVQFDTADGRVLLFTPRSVINARSVLAFHEVASGELVHRRAINGEWLRRAAFLDSDTVALSPVVVKVNAEHKTINEIRSTGEIRLVSPHGEANVRKPIPGFRSVDPMAMLMLTDDRLSRRAPLVVDVRSLLPASISDRGNVTEARLNELWTSLRAEPAIAQTAIEDFKSVAGQRAAEFLGTKLRSAKALDASDIEGAVAALAADDSNAVSIAQKKITDLGLQAAPNIRAALDAGVGPALQLRLEIVLHEVAKAAWTNREELRSLRALRVLAANESDEASVLLHKLATGDRSSRQTTACKSILRLRQIHASLPPIVPAGKRD